MLCDNKIKEILELKAGDENITFREYFQKLLITLWRDGESFSGKRPLGNSGWEYELYHPLVRAGYVEGIFSDCGEFIEDFSMNTCDKIIEEVINYLFRPTTVVNHTD